MTRGLPREVEALQGMEPRLKVWIEADGHMALSDYRVRLLEAVKDSGSLAEGAAAMGLSYRRAWGKIKELESNLGVRLLESTAGGQGGGSSHLTPLAEDLIARYNRFRAALTAYAELQFEAAFRD